jgi:methionine-gamma-lyase
MMHKFNHDETNAIHGGHIEDKQFGSLTTPLYMTSTFVFDSSEQGERRFLGEEEGYIYGRLGNPTIAELERRISILEHSESAAAAGSGMAAVSSSILSLVGNGDHIITSDALYGCTHSFLKHICTRFGIEVTFTDISKPENLVDAYRPNTKLIYIETPINPHLKLVDIEMIVNYAKSKNLFTICDNTFMTPLLQKPLDYGIDLVIHSATKYLNGHGDVVAGLIAGSKELIDEIKATTLKDLGGIMSPNDAWLILRGLKTLSIRVERHCENTQKVAEFLESHPLISNVYYPGLTSHPQYELAQKQMRASGGVLAFELDGTIESGRQLMNHVRLAKRAVSLGDAETLIQHPATMTHSPYDPEERRAGGITDTLIRMSVGLEHVDDIIHDLDYALKQVKSMKTEIER